MTTLRQQIRSMQQWVRIRHREARRRQLALAAERAQVLRAQWKAEEAEAKAWQYVCKRRTCPECGERRTWCCCTAACTDEVLQRLLRRLAGLNPTGAHDRVTRDEWTDALRGAAGPRGCGPAVWDNAVNAVEEDR